MSSMAEPMVQVCRGIFALTIWTQTIWKYFHIVCDLNAINAPRSPGYPHRSRYVLCIIFFLGRSSPNSFEGCTRLWIMRPIIRSVPIYLYSCCAGCVSAHNAYFFFFVPLNNIRYRVMSSSHPFLVFELEKQKKKGITFF